jgi:predicted transcriptional regulator
MKVKELAEKANLKVFSGEKGLDNEILGGYTSDLLSDVMGHAEAGSVWITLQTHKNIMAIASLKELAAIVVVKGYSPDEDTLRQSNEENIPILGTEAETFEISGVIYNLIKHG